MNVQSLYVTIVSSKYRVSNKTNGRFAATPESKLGTHVWQRRTLKLQVWRPFSIPFLLEFKIVM